MFYHQNGPLIAISCNDQAEQHPPSPQNQFQNSERQHEDSLGTTAIHYSTQDKMQHVLDAIENDGREQKVGRSDEFVVDRTQDTNGVQVPGYRKILSKKLNTLSTVHTDLTCKQSFVSAGYDRQHSKQTILISQEIQKNHAILDDDSRPFDFQLTTMDHQTTSPFNQSNPFSSSPFKPITPHQASGMPLVAGKPTSISISHFAAAKSSQQSPQDSMQDGKQKDGECLIDEKSLIEKARQRINKSVRRDSRDTKDSSDFERMALGAGHSVLGSKRFSMQPSIGLRNSLLIQNANTAEAQKNTTSLLLKNNARKNVYFRDDNKKSQRQVSPHMQTLVSDLEDQYNKHEELLNKLNQQKQNQLQQKFVTVEQQKEAIQSKVDSLQISYSNLETQNQHLISENERLRNENESITDKLRKTDKKLRTKEAELRKMEMEQQVQKIQMDWNQEDVYKFQEQNNKFTQLISEFEDQIKQLNEQYLEIEQKLEDKHDLCLKYRMKINDILNKKVKQMVRQQMRLGAEKVQQKKQSENEKAQEKKEAATEKVLNVDNEGEESENEDNRDLLIARLENKLLKLQKSVSAVQNKSTQQLQLSHDANKVLKQQSTLLQKQLDVQGKQADKIIEAQKKEMMTLMDNKLTRGIVLLHQDFKKRFETLAESHKATKKEHRGEIYKLKKEQIEIQKQQTKLENQQFRAARTGI